METGQEWQMVYQYGTIVIWPPDEVRAVVNTQREKYDPVSLAYCETHITITQPLIKELAGEEWDQIHQILQRFDVFSLNYGPVNSFLPYPCIWYEIEPREKILELRQALHQTGFFNLTLPHTEGFFPHLTITEGLSGPPVDEVLLNQIQLESTSGAFLCQELAFILPDEKFCFQVGKILPLGAV